jgi:hypothetical protein
MKTPLTLALIAAATFTIQTAQAQSSNDLVRTEVRPKLSSDRKDIKGSTAATKTQTVSLEIILAGKPKSPETRVVEWAIFGKDLKRNDVTKLESGDQPLSLDGFGRQTIETKDAKTTSTPDHTVVSKSGGRNSKGKTSAKRVDGTGVKYVGYGVLVKEGGTVVGKAFSGQSLEAEMH